MLPLHPQKQRKAGLTQEESALEEKVILLGPAWHFPNSGPPLLGRDITSSHPPQPFFLWRIMKLGKNVKKQCNEHLHRLHGDITVVNTLLHWHSPALSVYTYIYLYIYTCRYIHTHRLSLLNHLKVPTDSTHQVLQHEFPSKGILLHHHNQYKHPWVTTPRISNNNTEPYSESLVFPKCLLYLFLLIK